MSTNWPQRIYLIDLNLAEYPAENGEFFVPHSVSLIEDLNLLCVADRENERVQCFSGTLCN